MSLYLFTRKYFYVEYFELPYFIAIFSTFSYTKYSLVWLILFHWKISEAHEIIGNSIHQRLDIKNSYTSGASLQWTRWLPLKRSPNLHQPADPLEKTSDLFKHNDNIIVWDSPPSLERRVWSRNSATRNATWSSVVDARQMTKAWLRGVVPYHVLCTVNSHALFRKKGCCDTRLQDYVVTGQLGPSGWIW